MLINRPETLGKITCAEDAAKYAAKSYELEDIMLESMFVIGVNPQNAILYIEKVAQGTVNHVHPIIREIFKNALLKNATSIICIHNHPSGLTTPSREDQFFTKKLVEAGKVLEVKVLDHVIVGDNYYSFQENGEM